MKTVIPYNKPYLSGNELKYIKEAALSGKISGDGDFTKKCQQFFESYYSFLKCMLTTSCTDALELAALLIDIKPGDEVIMPTFTYTSTANAFLLRGAKIVFADSDNLNPNIECHGIENLITTKTKAIVVVHYAGIACDMNEVMYIAHKHNLFVIEDAAHSVNSFYNGRPLGSIGHLAAFSFHETKNIMSGEGGMLVINDSQFLERAEIIREKGTNRSAFFRREIDKYEWLDVGSSFLPSEITAAFLFAQLENLELIQDKRKQIWDIYYEKLMHLQIAGKVRLPEIPSYATNNAHIFYMICNSMHERDSLISYLSENGINAIFHYQALHQSKFFKDKYTGKELVNSLTYSNCLLRLPLYYELTENDVLKVTKTIQQFYHSNV